MSNKIIIISGLTCAGKTTLAKQLNNTLNITKTITCTTRVPREGEIDGVDYRFSNTIEFNRLICEGEILEYTEINNDGRVDSYGTLKSEILKDGIKLLILDLYGLVTFKKLFPDETLTLFIHTSTEERRRRAIEGRNWSEYAWEERCKSDSNVPENVSNYIDNVIDGDTDFYEYTLKLIKEFIQE